MSQSQSFEPQQSPYRRDDWWGDNEIETETVGHDPQPFDYERERAAYVAHDILKKTGRLVCPITLNAPPNRTASLFEWLETGEAEAGHDPSAMHSKNERIDLTDPEVFVPHISSSQWGDIEYGQRPSRSRYNPKYGYIVGPQILDRPRDEFLRIAEIMLEHFQALEEVSLTDRERDKLERDADRLKQAGDRRDTDILATIIRDATSEGSILEN